MGKPFNWTCPHCDKPQTVTDANVQTSSSKWYISGIDGDLGYVIRATHCVNPDCDRLTVDFTIRPYKLQFNDYLPDLSAAPIYSERVIPRGASKPQPDYISNVIKADYFEACLICDLSPKAAATLARRCLQGMIRDFCGISKGRLVDEISCLQKAVDEGTADRSISIESVRAIDSVRKIGNIGAHMERDINTIIEVDPGEARLLIGLIEALFLEWYVERHKLAARFAAVNEVATNKLR